MEWPNVWAPWRIDYIRRIPREGEPECFLCEAWARAQAGDRDRLVIHHEQAGMIILNRYPYTNGHLMVTTPEHIGDLVDLGPDRRARLMELIALAERLIHAVLNPQGINIGVNIGRAAGAGLPGHLHVHLVPRWGGDTNFMHVVGQVRVIPQALDEIHQEMTTALARLPRD